MIDFVVSQKSISRLHGKSESINKAKKNNNKCVHGHMLKKN